MIFLLIVTMTSLLLAAIMSTIAWRLAGDDRRRSEARVAALSADIHEAAPLPVPILARAGASRRGEVGFLADAPPARPAWNRDLELRPCMRSIGTPAGGDLFVAPERRTGSRALAIITAGALVVGSAAAMIVLPARLRGPVRASAPVTAAAPAADPLELVALGHERVGDQLTVRGIVRNPASGSGLDHLTAVVVVLAPDGAVLEGGRSDVEARALTPGGEAAFEVTVPRAGDIGRYRVSFRTDARVVSHVDRRHATS